MRWISLGRLRGKSALCPNGHKPSQKLRSFKVLSWFVTCTSTMFPKWFIRKSKQGLQLHSTCRSSYRRRLHVFMFRCRRHRSPYNIELCSRNSCLFLISLSANHAAEPPLNSSTNAAQCCRPQRRLAPRSASRQVPQAKYLEDSATRR